jgi:hypothetical protein
MATEKKIINLSSQYKNYLDEVHKVMLNYDINKIYSFIELNKYYNTINEINNKLLIVEKDIDNLFNNYDKKNENINKLKDLLRKRNTIVIRNLLSSELYREYLKKLSTEKKRTIKSIDSALTIIIKKYAMTWKCCWGFLEIYENGNVKKIELFDINDINILNKELHIK